MTSNPWIETRASGAERVRLFCFPYAGGNTQIFRGWQELLPADIGVYAVELPGRGGRFRDRPIADMATMIGAIKSGLSPLLDRPFAFFGHSMGAIIAFEAARQLRGAGGRAAEHLFVSARRGPGTRSRRPAVASLSDEQFVDRLRDLGGTPEAVLREPELMALFMPILRADFGLNDTYRPLPGEPLPCPLSVFGGRSDPEALEHELATWQSLAPHGFELTLFSGDHYFLNAARAELLRHVGEILLDPRR